MSLNIFTNTFKEVKTVSLGETIWLIAMKSVSFEELFNVTVFLFCVALRKLSRVY